MESVGPVGKPTFANTTRARRVASMGFCSSDKWSRSSVRTATAMPCMARFSLISRGVCMLERESTPRQVTQVTMRTQLWTQLTPRRALIDESDMEDHENQCEAHSRKTPQSDPQVLHSILSQQEIE